MSLTRNIGLGLLVVTTNFLGLVQLAGSSSIRPISMLLCVVNTYYWWYVSIGGGITPVWSTLAKSFASLAFADALAEGAAIWLDKTVDDWTSNALLTLTLAPCLSALANLSLRPATLFIVASVVCRYLALRSPLSFSPSVRSRILLVPVVGFLSSSLAAILSLSERSMEEEEESLPGVIASAPLVEMRAKHRHSISTFGIDVATIIEAHGLLEETIAIVPALVERDGLKSRLQSIANLLATQAPAMNVNQEPRSLVLTSSPGAEEEFDFDETNSVHSSASTTTIRRRRPINRRTTFTTVTDPMGLPKWEEQPTELRSVANALQLRRGMRANRGPTLVDVFPKRSVSEDGPERKKKHSRTPPPKTPSTPFTSRLEEDPFEHGGRERSRSVDFSSSHFNAVAAAAQRAVRASSTSPISDVAHREPITAAAPLPVESTVEEDSDDVGDGDVALSEPVVQFLKSIDTWDFEIFNFAELSPDHVLSHMASHVFTKTGLKDVFRISPRKFMTYFHAIEAGYHEQNPYHNRIHAADVLHAAYYLMTSPIPGFARSAPPTPIGTTSNSGVGDGSSRSSSSSDEPLSIEQSLISSQCDQDSSPLFIAFSPLEVMALFIASAIHDYDHPGRTNAFLVATHHELAVLYNDYSVLENHHVASAWKVLTSDKQFNFLHHLEAAEFKRLRFLVIELVLSTDLKKHFDILSNFSAKCSSIDWSCEQDRLLVLQIMIKMADINTPTKPSNLQVRWTELISSEFYFQGDDEKQLGLPVEQFMDREEPHLARLQIGFMRNLVAPLYNSFAGAGLLPGSREEIRSLEKREESQAVEADSEKGVKSKFVSPILENLQKNYKIWEARLLEEQITEQRERFRYVAKTAALKALKRMGLDSIVVDSELS